MQKLVKEVNLVYLIWNCLLIHRRLAILSLMAKIASVLWARHALMFTAAGYNTGVYPIHLQCYSIFLFAGSKTMQNFSFAGNTPCSPCRYVPGSLAFDEGLECSERGYSPPMVLPIS